MRNVIVLSTSVESMLAVSALSHALDGLAGKGNWNFDLQDDDHVLRVMGTLTPVPFIELLRDHGFAAAELPDSIPGLSEFQNTQRQVS